MEFKLDYLGDVKVLSKGQIVIPKEIREKLGIKPGDSLKIMLKNDNAIGLMRKEDLNKAIDEFNRVDFDKKENIDAMKDMQGKMDELMKHFNTYK